MLLKQIAENAQAVKQLAAAAPAIAFHETCKTAPDEMTLTEWAKTISHKVRVTAKGMLKLHEWLQRHHPDLLRVE